MGNEVLSQSNTMSIINRLLVVAQIKTDKVELTNDINTIFDVINKVNQLPSRVDSIDSEFGRIQLNDINIINEFKDFVYPSSVKMDPNDLMDEDLLDIKERSNDVKISLNDFIEAQLHVRSLFKSDMKSDVSKLSDLRRNVSLNDVYAISSFQIDSDGESIVKAHYSDRYYIPIPLVKFCSGFKKGLYYNIGREELVNLYVLNMFI